MGPVAQAKGADWHAHFAGTELIALFCSVTMAVRTPADAPTSSQSLANTQPLFALHVQWERNQFPLCIGSKQVFFFFFFDGGGAVSDLKMT